ncbi:MAG: nuclear transport factor 2 family protein [bacterium]|nr:nuclear transport factor 2 family protein [bacterium]
MKDFVGVLPDWEIERAIRHTMDLYAHSMDYGEEVVWRDCFTDDALFLVNDAQKDFAEIYRVEGDEQLRAYIAAYPRPPAIYAKHVCSQILIRVDGDTARAESFWLAVNSTGGEQGGAPDIMAFGRYRDLLVRCPDGRWRFRERICETESANWPEPGTYTDRENFTGGATAD